MNLSTFFFPNPLQHRAARSAFSVGALVLSAAACLAPGLAQAGTLEPVGRGTIQKSGFQLSSYSPQPISNFTTGASDERNRQTRSFFVYTLPAPPVGQVVVAAKLRIVTSPFGNSISGGAQTLTFHAGGPVPALETQNATYAQLGQGDVFASQVYVEEDDVAGAYKEIQLNAAGLAYLNAGAGTKVSLSARNSEEDRAQDVFVWAETGGFSADPGNGQSQLILTYGTTPTVAPPVITTNAPETITPNQGGMCFTVNATSDAGIAGLSVSVVPLALNGALKVVDKSYSAVWTVNGGDVCIVDSGGVGTRFFIYGTAVANDGQVNVNAFELKVVKKK